MIPTIADLKNMGLWLHELTWQEQVVVLANTVRVLQNSVEWSSPTQLENLNLNDFKIFTELVQHHEYRGILAGGMMLSFYEYSNQLGYLGFPEEVKKQLWFGYENALWPIYTGMMDYDPELMGQIVHDVIGIGQNVFPGITESIHTVMYPSSAWASYTQAMGSLNPQPKHCLVLGAMSALTVYEYWLMKQNLLDNCEMTIIDVTPGLNQLAAEHYGIEFEIFDAMEIGDNWQGKPIDLITTDRLTPFLVNTDRIKNEADYHAHIIQAFEELAVQMYQALSPGGYIVLVEKDFGEIHTGEYSDTVLDALYAAGFRELEVKQSTGQRTRANAIKALSDNTLVPVDNPHNILITAQK